MIRLMLQLSTVIVTALVLFLPALPARSDILAARASAGDILRFEEVSGQYLGVFATGLNAPEGLSFGPDGKLYVCEYWNMRVVRLLADGSRDPSLPDGVFCTLPYNPLSLAVDDNGFVYVADQIPGLYKFRPDGTLDSVLNDWFYTRDVKIGPGGYLYVLGSDGTTAVHGVVRYRTDGSDASVYANFAGQTGFHGEGIAFDPNGVLVFSNTGGGIWQWNGGSNYTPLEFSNGNVRDSSPQGLLFDSNGDLIIGGASYIVRIHGGTAYQMYRDGLNPQWLTLTPRSTNEPPVAENTSFSINEDTELAGQLQAADPNGDALSYTVTSPQSHGTLTLSNGTFTYLPELNYSGPDTFTFRVSDGRGGEASATVTITVNPMQDPPSAMADNATTLERQPVTIVVLANDTDPDGDSLAIQSVTQPAHGIVVINADGTLSYTSAGQFSGTDSFSYTIDDGNGNTATAVVMVIVQPINHPPHAVNDNDATSPGQPVVIDVLSNDRDSDADSLTVTIVEAPADGSVEVLAGGAIRYVPNANFRGNDVFKYQISDGRGGTDQARVRIRVR